MSDSEQQTIPFDGKPAFELVGPFQVYHVVVDGRVIPRLTGYHDDEKIALVVDGRFSASFWPADAQQAAWLIAQALAVGEGYSHSGAETKGTPFARKVAWLDALPRDEPAP